MIPSQQFCGMIMGYEFVNRDAPIMSRISQEQGKFHTFMEKSESHVKQRTNEYDELKRKYEEILILDAPATFWGNSAKSHRTQGFIWITVLMVLLAVGMTQAS